MTQPPIIPGPPSPFDDMPKAPKYVPPPAQPQPQIVYVQAPPTSGAVSAGVMNATGKIVYIILAVCLGIPLTGCLLTLIFGGLGSLLGGDADIHPSP